jgi:hypothetical protein
MRTSSCKAKGRKGQQALRDAILAAFPALTADDVRSTPTGVTGADLMLSRAAKDAFPYSPEAKQVEKLNIWQAISQAESNAGNLTPLVVFGRNRTKPWAAVPLDHFMKLVAPK